MNQRRRRGRKTAWLIAVLAMSVLILGWVWRYAPNRATGTFPVNAPLLLAPMMDLDGCLWAHRPDMSYSSLPPEARAQCLEQGHSSALVEATLAPFKDGAQFRWGYTLKLPLLQLYMQDRAGRWVLDDLALANVARTLATSTRPVVLYLFSTHFSAHAPVEAVLARDPDNLAQLATGLMAPEQYHGAPLYPWSVARTDNRITQMRAEAIDGVTRHVCALPEAQRKHLVAVTLLGETHHLFPSFEQGMAFDAPYLLTDYSDASLKGFAAWLEHRFQTVEALNRFLGSSSHAAFTDVQPPGRAFAESGASPPVTLWGPYAHGVVPVSGWLHDGRGASQSPARVRVSVNGRSVMELQANLSRQDVLAALPQLGRAEVGFQALLDYRKWDVGIHRIEVFWLTDGKDRPVLLGSRDVEVRSKNQVSAAQPAGSSAPQVAGALPGGVRAWLDNPTAGVVLQHNPLAELWHAYRSEQVADYIGYFSRRLEGTCLAQVTRYTHQIFPHANPGWDVTRFAVDTSLSPPPPLRLGVSLYGEAAFGDSFLSGPLHTAPYGVTEFHPLKPMSARQLSEVLERHRKARAEFVSFFLETRWAGQRVRPPQNPYAFEPDNPYFGSDSLYEAARRLTQ